MCLFPYSTETSSHLDSRKSASIAHAMTNWLQEYYSFCPSHSRATPGVIFSRQTTCVISRPRLTYIDEKPAYILKQGHRSDNSALGLFTVAIIWSNGYYPYCYNHSDRQINH